MRLDKLTAKLQTALADAQSLDARVRVDTPKEWEYYEHGGILPYVLRQLAS